MLIPSAKQQKAKIKVHVKVSIDFIDYASGFICKDLEKSLFGLMYVHYWLSSDQEL